MSTLTDPATGATTAARLERIRMASFGALTMLFLQFVLGTAYSLYGTAPTAKKSVGLFSSPLLAIHVVLGILLVIAAAMLGFRVVHARAGAALLGWIVGETIATDPVISGYLLPRLGPEGYHYVTLFAALAGAILVLVVGGLWRRSKQGAAEDNKEHAAQGKVSAAE